MQKSSPKTVWNSGPGTPTIQPIPRANGAYEIAIIIDGGYNLEDAQHMTKFWSQQLTRAGLKNRPRLIAEAIKIEPNRTHPGAYVVTVKCPYCPGTHTHGVDALESNGGHRAPHCHDPEAQQWNKAGYIIHIPEALRQEQL